MAAHMKQVKKLKHHEQAELCVTRAKYRQGRKLTAVKVYTINQESKYLLIQGVPSVGAKSELENICSEYGLIDELNALDDYPSEEYTESYSVKYKEIQCARFAKRKLDDRSFFGGTLHVCYAPEFETLADTREKLNERRAVIAAKTKKFGYNIQKKHGKWKRNSTSLSSTQTTSNEVTSQPQLETELIPPPAQEPVTYIWAGKTYTVENTQPINEEKKISEQRSTSSQIPFIPRQLKRPLAKSDPLESTSTSIREKMEKVSEPKLDVNIKRRKKN